MTILLIMEGYVLGLGRILDRLWRISFSIYHSFPKSAIVSLVVKDLVAIHF